MAALLEARRAKAALEGQGQEKLDFVLCTSHDLAPLLQEACGLPKQHFETRVFKDAYARWEKDLRKAAKNASRLQHSFLLSGCIAFASAQNLTDDQVNAVKQRLAEGATHSWELGTRAQTLLELEAPDFSVLTVGAQVPPPTPLNASSTSALSEVFAIVQKVVSEQSNTSATDGEPLVDGEGSAGDPASLGAAVLLANWTGLGGEDYAGAAQRQLEYLFGSAVPKTSDGAISHRVSQLQLWSDSVYMVPPFIASYGVTTSNRSMVEAAYTQIKLYRNYLSDSTANGLWKHILLGDGTDEGHWSTGNGWAAAGMLRVLGTMKNSQFSSSFKSEIKDLGTWTSNIHSGMFPLLQSNNLFKNYPDDSNSTNFDDAASTALIASTVYRLALLTGTHHYIPQAEKIRQTLFSASSSNARRAYGYPLYPRADSSPAPSSTATSPSSPASSSAAAEPSASAFASAAHFSEDGWLTPVVNPDNYGTQGSDSPESEAFVLMLHSAWRDWAAAGSPGANGAGALVAGRTGVGAGLLAALVAAVWL
ncbi:hypothetical protein FA95DRAFT_1553040 [Auriscalpium vulgare]|uniref:Uncharacterized protein n=1 Tax=Auriscalpium vulgare TaxID=40419 RepID=A0ACB8S9C8_9AGAM|nr:hypothetical protein FA95DRAFT_1553040 [Auriscalpium vulgare]